MLKYSYDASGSPANRTLENFLPPEITGQPVSRGAAPGEIVTFSVMVADASAVTFQWKFNGADIPGATSDSLLLTNINSADEGQYSVVVANSAGNVTSAAAVLQTDSDGFLSVTAPAGLVGWWRAEGNAQDSAGANHGALRNGVGFAAGRVGQAFALDGVDGCIEIPDAPALRPVSVTLEVWVAFDENNGVKVVCAKPPSSYAIWLDFGTLRAGGKNGQLIVPFSPLPGVWHHLAYTFDDGAKQQVLYVDGIQVADSGAAGAFGSIAYSAQPLFLGCQFDAQGARSFFLHCRIDEAAIYNRALSGLEIASIFDAGPAGKRL